MLSNEKYCKYRIHKYNLQIIITHTYLSIYQSKNHNYMIHKI